MTRDEERTLMHPYFTEADIALMCTVRAAWDSAKQMNPGMLLPVRACNEHMPLRRKS